MQRKLPPLLPLNTGKRPSLKDLYGPPVKFISDEDTLNKITNAMGNKDNFYEGIRNRIWLKTPNGITNEEYQILSRELAREIIIDLLKHKEMYDRHTAKMVDKVVDDFMRSNPAPPTRYEIPSHIWKDPPPYNPSYDEVPEPPPTLLRKIQKTLGDLNKTINTLARKKGEEPDDNDPYPYNGGKSKKSKKQQRKTKAKKTHRKRTQRK